MTKSYKLTAGPGKHDLVLGLSEGRPVFFRGIEEKTNHPDLFRVRIKMLKLSEKQPLTAWAMEGRIIEKNGRPTTEPKKCSAMFYPQERHGHFNEEDLIKEYSAEHLWNLPEEELRRIIEEFKASIPKRLKRLEEYAAKFGLRDRLIIEAMHMHGLDDACLNTETHHWITSRLVRDGFRHAR
jgi:hypothetical protein